MSVKLQKRDREPLMSNARNGEIHVLLSLAAILSVVSHFFFLRVRQEMYDFSFFVQIQQENVGFLCDVPYNGMVSNQTDWQCRVHHCKLSKHDGSHISQVRKILLKLMKWL